LKNKYFQSHIVDEQLQQQRDDRLIDIGDRQYSRRKIPFESRQYLLVVRKTATIERGAAVAEVVGGRLEERKT